MSLFEYALRRCGRDCMVVGFLTALYIHFFVPIQIAIRLSVPITTESDVVSSNPFIARRTQYNIYVIKFVSDLRPVCGYLRVLRFLPPIKLTAMI